MRAMELAVGYTGHGFPHLSKLALGTDPGSVTTRIPSATGKYGIAALDITLTAQNEIRLIEANGSNVGLTSVVVGNDYARALHMWMSFRQKPCVTPSTVILPFKPGLMHLPEFFARASTFASLVSEERSAALRCSEEDLGSEEVAVVCGPIPAIADRMQCFNDCLTYRSRRVSFACNPSILVELQRRRLFESEAQVKRVSKNVFHDGEFISLVHDKGLQQDKAAGTGITPLYYEEAWNVDDGCRVIARFHERGLVAIGKINAGSGGTGVSVFPVGQTPTEVRTELSGMITSAIQRYGDSAESTIFPLRFFEFARSTDFMLPDGPHLWDLRMLCLVWPGYIDVTPCLLRICPVLFDGRTYARGTVVSNLSDRPPSLEFVRSALDMSARNAVGIDAMMLRKMIEACAAWCENACTS